MGSVPTVKIKRLSTFVIINQTDFNPEIHELFDPEVEVPEVKEKEDLLVSSDGLTDESDLLADPHKEDESTEIEIPEVPEVFDAEGESTEEVKIPVDAKSSRSDIEEYGRSIGIDLDKRKSAKNMFADLSVYIDNLTK